MLTNTTQTVLPNDLTFALFAPSLKTTITDICHLLVRVRDVLGLQFVVMVRLRGTTGVTFSGRGFDSRPFCFQATTLGKLLTHTSLCHQAV